MPKLQQNGRQFILTLPVDIVELEGWQKGQEIKLRRIECKGESYVCLVPQ